MCNNKVSFKKRHLILCVKIYFFISSNIFCSDITKSFLISMDAVCMDKVDMSYLVTYLKTNNNFLSGVARCGSKQILKSNFLKNLDYMLKI